MTTRRQFIQSVPAAGAAFGGKADIPRNGSAENTVLNDPPPSGNLPCHIGLD